MQIDRRHLLGAGASMAGLMLAGYNTAFAAGATPMHLNLEPGKLLARMPLDFTGISVEKMQLTDPSYFSADNTSLVAILRRLTRNGILRIGGNSSEFCWWRTSKDQQPPVIKTVGQGRADNWMPQNFYAIDPVAVEHLRGLLDACGWRCIWGFNFGTGTAERNAEEAAFVARALGDRLVYFQIGNEPDFYREANNRLRPAGWDFPDYLSEWTAMADAISARVPDARFGGPDVGANVEWIVRFGAEARKRIGQRLFGLSGHYYASGPPDNPKVTPEMLMHSGDAVARRMAAVAPAVAAAGVGYRMTEGNSCYRGGKAGMSNALAAALWGGDYMLDMAAHGATGVNFHCGSGAAIAASLGGKLPGAFTAHDREIAKLGAFYAPIAGNQRVGFSARPLYYGMMLAECFAGSQMIGCQISGPATGPAANITAFAARHGTGYQIALFNKEPGRALDVSLNSPPHLMRMEALALTGPSLSATEGINFAGSEVAAGNGKWQEKTVRHIAVKPGQTIVRLPQSSALLLRLTA